MYQNIEIANVISVTVEPRKYTTGHYGLLLKLKVCSEAANDRISPDYSVVEIHLHRDAMVPAIEMKPLKDFKAEWEERQAQIAQAERDDAEV